MEQQYLFRVRGDLHISEHGVIGRDLGEVGFQDVNSVGKSHMTASTKQGHTGEAEDRSNQ